MGLLGSLFGWDQSMAALNAVLAYQFITKCNQEQKALVTREVITIISSVQRNRSEQEIINQFNQELLLVQMNFVALACDNLGFSPLIPNNVWTRVKNPYVLASKISPLHIDSALEAIRKQDGYSLTWPKTGNVSFTVSSI